MTANEAIDVLRRLQEPEPWNTQINQRGYEALEMAIAALEKQTPQKPTQTEESRPYYECPCCKYIVLAAQDYCERCGQNIDWRY